MYKNLTVGKGETLDHELRYKDAEGNAIDLSDSVVTLQVLGKVSYTETLETNEGTIALKVEDEITSTWPVGNSNYRVILENAGDKTWLLEGRLNVR